MIKVKELSLIDKIYQEIGINKTTFGGIFFKYSQF